MKRLLVRTSFLLVCAIILRWASVDHAWALVPALVGIFSVLVFRPPLEWVAGGLLVGLIYTGAIILALAKWGPVPMLALWLGLSVAFATFFGCVGWAASNSKKNTASHFVIAGVWCAGLFVLDRAVYTPVFLTAPLAVESGLFRNVLGLVGAPAAESLVVAAAAALAIAFRSKSARPLYTVVPLLLFVLVPASFWSSDSEDQGVLHVVQPNFQWSDYAARGWSFEAKDYLARTLDDLTRVAVAQHPGTVVWPENGSGVADAQIASRTKTLSSILAGTGSDLIVAGLVYENSRRMVGATHIHENGVGQFTSKSKLVPLAESDVHPGTARVLHTQAGALGVSVCFDILFGDLVRGLVRQGAEILVVTSDNASFGTSLIPKWHEAYAVLRAAEAGRSILFSANRGPAVSFDVVTNTVQQHTTRAKQEVATVTLHRSRKASLQRWHLVATGLLCAPLFCLFRPKKKQSVSRNATPLALAFLLGVVAGPVVEVMHVASVRRLALTGPIKDALARARGVQGIDSRRSSFVQSKQQSCGLAALAYAVTLLGDRAFEENFSDVPLTDRGSTLQDLAEAARQRGFTVETLRAPSVDSIDLTHGRVALLHQEPGHYLVASYSAEGVLIFDPATGSLQPVKNSALKPHWRGAALRVSMSPLL